LLCYGLTPATISCQSAPAATWIVRVCARKTPIIRAIANRCSGSENNKIGGESRQRKVCSRSKSVSAAGRWVQRTVQRAEAAARNNTTSKHAVGVKHDREATGIAQNTVHCQLKNGPGKTPAPDKPSNRLPFPTVPDEEEAAQGEQTKGGWLGNGCGTYGKLRITICG
jgi:hypothetical protein